MKLCEQLHKRWFELRNEFEKLNHIDTSYRVLISETKNKGSLGMCKRYGDGAYISIPLPQTLTLGINSNLRGN
jgi:hypothetical protein